MNHLKTSIRSKENKRKRNFVLKLLFLIFLDYIYLGNTFLNSLAERFPFLLDLVRALIFLLSANLVISLGRIVTLRFYLQKTAETKVLPNFVIGIDRISTILNFLALLIGLMLAFGIKPLEFLTSITIVAAAIALLTKEYITNIVNGLIIMFSEQLEIGDKINIGKNTGFIRDITLINLVMKSETGEVILIPNAIVLSTDIINYSKNNTHQVVFDSEIPYSNDLQLSKLEDELGKILEGFKEYVTVEGAQLNVLERKSESLLIRYQFPIISGQKEVETGLRKSINQGFLNWKNEQRKG
ncbi:Small-conductance mechanosensitive channel [Algoriphagus faecimaris]|uniref:Small-conductance mechanosensitive channel n=1 Tax=Algoriphagus faecimaris TaxID=686796 RepID=A0A1G6MUC2_9BACT|nr:mechanosensitive ion channel domain-containing protein [Algoriphagus faecimaris]SDC58576.1 Small-conductance mechanosensitive channel [Algoriphagus faecimaris]